MADEIPAEVADARSLEIQERIEDELRRIAWDQHHHRKNRRFQIPMCEDDASQSPASPGMDVASAAGIGAAENVETGPWANFQRLALTEFNAAPGVYGILHRPSARIYVGSSVNIVTRIRKHIADLEGERHHSPRLQNAYSVYGLKHFEFLLIERVDDILDLRVRDQYWIDRLWAFSKGFNTKSRADGPEPSIETHIHRARLAYWPSIYARFAPNPDDFEPSGEDWSRFWSDLKDHLPKKSKQLAISAALVFIAVQETQLGALLLPVVFWSGPLLLFDWPDGPRSRAERRYRETEAGARSAADGELIDSIAEGPYTLNAGSRR